MSTRFWSRRFLCARAMPLAYLVVLMLTGCVTSTPSSMTNANHEKYLKSLSGETPAQIAFVNKSGQRVKVYWLDYSGNLVFYKDARDR